MREHPSEELLSIHVSRLETSDAGNEANPTEKVRLFGHFDTYSLCLPLLQVICIQAASLGTHLSGREASAQGSESAE